MANRPTRPSLQAPDLSPAVVRPPATNPQDRRFEEAAQFETPEALRRGVEKGTVRVTNLDTVPAGPERRRAPETSLSTKVPEYVVQQLRRRYADTGVTIRNQILLALRDAGIEVSDDDLYDERKRPRR